ncbi:hypothetical protein VTL71DRAFT_9722 [Oculimacula yallundae]|uniref:Uncharacterized protein n=1 Tax=Oculimacula yallundae TaxID=86028 RepID=A0ABR4BRM2_9HELO
MLSPRTSTGIQLSIALLSLLATAIYLFSPSGTTITTLGSHDYKTIYQTAVKGKKALFVENLLRGENEIDGAFDNSTLVELCRTRIWIEGLIFKCEAPEGGIANVRNVILNCVRYAIEGGATSFIVPEILLRTSTSPEAGTHVPFTHYFSLPHFTSTLNALCPQITLISHQNDLFNIPSTAKPVPLIPTSITTSLLSGFILGAPGNWSSEFHAFLNITHPLPFNAQKPVLVSLASPLLQFPLTYDDPHLVAQFGRILQFREDVRRIAAGVVWALDKKHTLGLKSKGGGVKEGAFYGAHLRTGADATSAGWTSYAIQEGNYIAHAEKLKLGVIYLSSTSPADTETFTQSASNRSIAVETKDSLLADLAPQESGAVYNAKKGFESEWAMLQGLSWDQQLLVDYEVLLRSSVFGGVWESSFTWNVAMRRHVVVSGRKGWTSIAQRGGVGEVAVGAKQEVQSRRRMIESRQEVESEVPPSDPGHPFGVDFDADTKRVPVSSTSISRRPRPTRKPTLKLRPRPSSTSTSTSTPTPSPSPAPEPVPEPEPAAPAPKPEPTPEYHISTTAPPGSHAQYSSTNPAFMSSTEADLVLRLAQEEREAGAPATAKSGEPKLGDVSWGDGLSVVFGPDGKGGRAGKAGGREDGVIEAGNGEEGREGDYIVGWRIRGSLWP